MKKRMRSERSETTPQARPDLGEMLAAIQHQLSSLERKLDSLLNQPPRFDQPRRQGDMRQDNNFRERAMFKAVCAQCKTECEVPFRPSGDRPVYCKECFAKRKNDTPFTERNQDRRHEARPRRIEEEPKKRFYDKFTEGRRKRSAGRGGKKRK